MIASLLWRDLLTVRRSTGSGRAERPGLAVFALIAAEQGVGRIAKALGISRTTVETHCQNIKLRLGYPNAEALKRGARELFRTTRAWQTS